MTRVKCFRKIVFSVIQWVNRCMLNMSTKDKAQDRSLVTMRQTDLRGITLPFPNVCAIRGNTPGRVHKVLLLSPERGCLFRTHPLVWVSRMWNVVANNSFPYSVYVWYQFLGRQPNVCLLWFCKKANVRFWHVRRIIKLWKENMGQALWILSDSRIQADLKTQIRNITIFDQMDLFHISGFFSSGSRHYTIVFFMTFNKRENI